jgi:hypothetical protein
MGKGGSGKRTIPATPAPWAAGATLPPNGLSRIHPAPYATATRAGGAQGRTNSVERNGKRPSLHTGNGLESSNGLQRYRGDRNRIEGVEAGSGDDGKLTRTSRRGATATPHAYSTMNVQKAGPGTPCTTYAYATSAKSLWVNRIQRAADPWRDGSSSLTRQGRCTRTTTLRYRCGPITTPRWIALSVAESGDPSSIVTRPSAGPPRGGADPHDSGEVYLGGPPWRGQPRSLKRSSSFLVLSTRAGSAAAACTLAITCAVVSS